MFFILKSINCVLYKSFYLKHSLTSIFKLFIVFVVCSISFNALSCAASDENVLDQKESLKISDNKILDHHCLLILETNSKGQGELSNLRQVYSSYCSNQAFLGQNNFSHKRVFHIFNCELYTSSYFRAIFLYIRVINAP